MINIIRCISGCSYCSLLEWEESCQSRIAMDVNVNKFIFMKILFFHVFYIFVVSIHLNNDAISTVTFGVFAFSRLFHDFYFGDYLIILDCTILHCEMCWHRQPGMHSLITIIQSKCIHYTV